MDDVRRDVQHTAEEWDGERRRTLDEDSRERAIRTDGTFEVPPRVTGTTGALMETFDRSVNHCAKCAEGCYECDSATECVTCEEKGW